MPRIIQVLDYDPHWPDRFHHLRDAIWPAVHRVAIGIEHVGSTSVPGMAAKPVIDIDIVVAARDQIPSAVSCLAPLGYHHRGNLGIEDREAFHSPLNSIPHNLYVCLNGCIALRNHLTLRDHLRTHPEDIQAYSTLKKSLAHRFPEDIDQYVHGKSELILSILSRYNFSAQELGSIAKANEARDPARDTPGSFAN